MQKRFYYFVAAWVIPRLHDFLSIGKARSHEYGREYQNLAGP